jgi:Transcriptional regulator
MTTPQSLSEPASQILKSPRRWQRRKTARFGEILQAAAQLMAEKGESAMRMAEIAERAGITKGTIYLYFTNKAEVLKSLAERQTAQAVAAE